MCSSNIFLQWNAFGACTPPSFIGKIKKAYSARDGVIVASNWWNISLETIDSSNPMISYQICEIEVILIIHTNIYLS